jgi:tetratricopeptide (TPR) repeat protein
MTNIRDLLGKAQDIINNTNATIDDLEQQVERLNAYLDDHIGEMEFEEEELAEQILEQLHERIDERKVRKPVTGPLPEVHEPEENPVYPSFHDPDPVSEQLMDQAEELFYNGKLREAIGLYERVLAIEPHWQRANDQHEKAQEYLDQNKLPPLALPPKAARLYGRAQSAERLQRFASAIAMLEEAIEVVRQEKGIKWEEGETYLTQLYELQDVHSEYEAGIRDLERGNFRKAKEKLERAYNLQSTPKFEKALTEINTHLENIDDITRILNDPLNIEECQGAKKLLAFLSQQYPASQELVGLSITVKEKEEQYQQLINGIKTLTIENNFFEVMTELKNMGKCYELADQIYLEIEKFYTLLQEAYALLPITEPDIYFSQTTKEMDECIQRILTLPPKYLFVKQLQHKVRLMLENLILAKDGTKAYLEIMERKRLREPFNDEVAFRYEWAKKQIERKKRQEQVDKIFYARIDELNKWSKAWFWISITTATILLIIAIFIIFQTFNENNPLTSLTSLLSLIPVFATKLIYDQHRLANREAEKVFESMLEKDQKIQNMEQEEYEELKRKIFNKPMTTTIDGQ